MKYLRLPGTRATLPGSPDEKPYRGWGDPALGVAYHFNRRRAIDYDRIGVASSNMTFHQLLASKFEAAKAQGSPALLVYIENSSAPFPPFGFYMARPGSNPWHSMEAIRRHNKIPVIALGTQPHDAFADHYPEETAPENVHPAFFRAIPHIRLPEDDRPAARLAPMLVKR